MSWRRGADTGAVTTLPEPEVGRDAPPPIPPAPPKPAMWRKLAIAGILLSLVVGLVWQMARSDDGGGEETAPTSPATTAVTASATTLPATVVLDPSKPPELRNTGEDFDAIVRSVTAFEDWVYRYDPDPKWAPFILDPDNQGEFGYQRLLDSLAALKADGQHYDALGGATKVLFVRVNSRESENLVVLYVVREGLAGDILDRQGNAVLPVQAVPPTGFIEQWIRREDGRWREVQSDVLGPPGEGVVP